MALTAPDMYDALRARHPALDEFGRPGQWITLREWRNIDLLALDAWREARVIGYEVKVSRGDMRTELLKPHKRSEGVAMTTEFYFAVPKGMLKPSELEYEEPEWSPEDFADIPCPDSCNKRLGRKSWYRAKTDNSHHRGMRRLPVPYAGPDYPRRNHDYRYSEWLWCWGRCPTCGGSAVISKSRVKIEAPTLWVPKDVGLIEVSEGGQIKIVKPSPKREFPASIMGYPIIYNAETSDQARRERQAVNHAMRWTSVRPDPRHK